MSSTYEETDGAAEPPLDTGVLFAQNLASLDQAELV